jgi:hypothetical protein
VTLQLVSNPADGWPRFTPVNPQFQQLTLTIAAGASLSTDIDLGIARFAGVIVPSGWTAANITFQASVDDITWFELYDDSGTEVTLTVGGTPPYFIIAKTPAVFAPVRFLKLRSGTAALPVVQVSAASLIVVAVP